MFSFKKHFKSLVSIISFALIVAFISPQNANALVLLPEGEEYYPEVEMTESEISEAIEMRDVLLELDANLDMTNLENNTTEEISTLSESSQEFYSLYKETEPISNETLLPLFITSENIAGSPSKPPLNSDVMPPPGTSTYLYGGQIGSVTNTSVSNTTITNINEIAGYTGSAFTFAALMAKKYGKNPTFLTLMLVAISALGMKALNTCNRYKKGIVITRTRVGATNYFTCKSQ